MDLLHNARLNSWQYSFISVDLYYFYDKYFTMVQVGNKIRKIRELRNFTQKYMSEANYSKIERDEISITIDRLEKITTVFELNLI